MRKWSAHVSVFVVALTLGAHVACGGDDATSPAATPAPAPAPSASQGPGASADAAADPADAGGEQGEVVTENGDLPEIDPDASAGDGDGGLIFQPACILPTPGPYVASTCASRLPTYSSVGLVSGTYELDSVLVLGTATFCSQTFKVYEHAGVLVVNAASPTSATLRYFDRFRSKASPLATAINRYDVAVTASGTDLTFGPATCQSGAEPPAAAKFSSGTTTEGKKYIRIRLPYGANGSALYRFVEP